MELDDAPIHVLLGRGKIGRIQAHYFELSPSSGVHDQGVCIVIGPSLDDGNGERLMFLLEAGGQSAACSTATGDDNVKGWRSGHGSWNALM